MTSLLTRVLKDGSVGDDVYVSRLRERLFAKINRGGPGDCWEWTAHRSDKGYGKIGVARKVMQAHRVVYELLVGPIPDGMVIDHLCRNRGCMNPAHMEPVTSGENTLRGEGMGARHARATHCINGHLFPERKEGKRNRVCWICHGKRNEDYRRRKVYGNPEALAKRREKRRMKKEEQCLS